MEVLGVLEILGKCPPTFESCPETDIIKVVMGGVSVYWKIMYIMYGISNLRSAGITWSMRYGRITYPVLTCSMPGWIGLNRGRVSTCSLTMGRVCKTCSARRSSAGPTLGSTGLLGSERDEKDYTFTCYIVIYIYFYTWKLVTALM